LLTVWDFKWKTLSTLCQSLEIIVLLERSRNCTTQFSNMNQKGFKDYVIQ
jgi:hypothetical protein